MERLNVGDIIQHFKRETLENPGNRYLYEIKDIATHTETKEKLVIYKALYSDKDMGVDFGVYARPYDMFMSVVDSEKYPQIKSLYRFTKWS